MKRYAQRERSAAPSTPATAAVGIDLAKRSLAACLRLPSGKSYQRQFANELSGFQALLAWLAHYPSPPVPVCMEATGTYGEALAVFLHEQGYPVSVVNPHRIVHYAKSQGTRHKTDPVDARVIAEFCAKEQPPRWTPPPARYRYLQALLRHQETLEQDQQRERNRLKSAEHPPFVRQSLEAGLAQLEAALTAVAAEIQAHLASQPELQAQLKLLLSIPGIGEETALWLLAELGGCAGFQRAPEVASYVGVEPRLRQSGPWKGTTRMSKQGNVWLRKALYFPALSALRWNPVIRAFGERLRERGKAALAVVVAAMRKLLHLAFGVLRHQRPFDPAWTGPTP